MEYVVERNAMKYKKLEKIILFFHEIPSYSYVTMKRRMVLWSLKPVVV